MGMVVRLLPTSHRGVRAGGSATSLDEARADFEEAWHRLLPEITKADFDQHRRYRALEAWKLLSADPYGSRRRVLSPCSLLRP
jgi:hypothetical protein